MQTAGKGHGFALVGLYAVAALFAGVAPFLYFGGSGDTLAVPTGSVQLAGPESMRPSVTACAEDFMTRKNHR